MDDDDVERWSEAETAVEEVAAEAILPRGGDGGFTSVQSAGKGADDAEDGANESKGRGEIQLDFNITEYSAREPGRDVVIRP